MATYYLMQILNGQPLSKSDAIESERPPEIVPPFTDVWTEAQWLIFLANLPNPDYIPPNFECTSIEDFQRVFQLIDKSDYRRWRFAMKEYVIALGGTEENGFNLLSQSEKYFVATHNIGSGLQRLNAIPNHHERDKTCFDYLMINEGGATDGMGGSALKNIGGVWLKALCFSRTAHITTVGYGFELPTFIFMQLQIQSQSPLEISGNILDFYRTQGIDGIALGNPPLGISDFTESTIGTRYETNGLRTNATILQSVAQSFIAGFDNINAFADELLSIIKFGKPSYL